MSQKAMILEALRNGQRLTPLSALIRVHTMSLSQRCGELRRDGHPVKSRLIKVGEKHVAEYYYETDGNYILDSTKRISDL